MCKKLFMLLLLLVHSLPGFAKDWSQLYLEERPKVPYIFANGGLCAGSLVEPDLILTAWHCVATLNRVLVQMPGANSRFQEAEVVAKDSKGDIAYLLLASPIKDLKPMTLAAKEYKLIPGQEVATIGHPMGIKVGFWTKDLEPERTHLLSAGVVSKVNQDNFVTDLSLSPGNSGGSVFNTNKEVIGVVSRKLVGVATGNIGYAGSLNRIYSTYDQAKSRRPLPWYKAAHRFEFNLLSVYDGKIDDVSTIEPDTQDWGAEIGFFIFSRIRLSYMATDMANGGMWAFKTGWLQNITFSPLSNLGLLVYGGEKGYEQASKNEVSSPFWGLGIELSGIRIEYEKQSDFKKDNTTLILSVALAKNVIF